MLNGGLYDRISKDRRGGRGVERQDAKNRQLAATHSITVVDRYTDNDTPASTGELRGDFERLLADITAGRINAVVSWDLDRLWRLPIENERFLALARAHNARLFDRYGEIDVTSTRGRLVTRIKAAMSAGEVEQLSDRVREELLKNAQEGKPHGRQTYGWQRRAILDDRGNRIGSEDIVDADQAAVVEEICQRIVAGDSLLSICIDLNNRGVPPPGAGDRKRPRWSGAPHLPPRWRPAAARWVATRPRNVALRVHHGRLTRAAWDPIIDKELYEKVMAVLANPARRSREGRGARYLASGTSRCGLCDGAMRSGQASKRPVYRCSEPDCGKVTRGREPVDALLEGIVVGWLSRPDAAELLAASSGQNGAADAAKEARALRARLDNLAMQAANDEIDDQQLAILSAALRPKLKAAETRMRAVPSGDVLADAIGPDAEYRWHHEWDISRRRAILNALLAVTIQPVGRGHRIFDPGSVTIRWKVGKPPAEGPAAAQREA